MGRLGLRCKRLMDREFGLEANTSGVVGLRLKGFGVNASVGSYERLGLRVN